MKRSSSRTTAPLLIVATYPVANWFAAKLGTLFPVFGVSRQTVYMQLAAALLVGTVAALFPSVRAARLHIVDGLRNIG